MTKKVKDFIKTIVIYTPGGILKGILFEHSWFDKYPVEFQLFKLDICIEILERIEELITGDPDFIVLPIGWSKEDCMRDFAKIQATEFSKDELIELEYFLNFDENDLIKALMEADKYDA